MFVCGFQTDLHFAEGHAPCHIMRGSVNGVSTIISFGSWVLYVPIGWRHPFITYCQPLLAKTTAICSVPHSEK